MSEELDKAADDNGANKAFRDSIKAITDNIANVAIKTIADEYIDPFRVEIGQQIEAIGEQQKKNEELFTTNVLEAVKKSRRKILESRLAEFDIENLIKKLTEVPESIANNTLSEKNLRREVKLLKEAFEVEMNLLITAAAQQGLAGGNADDRDGISKLIEDRVRNTETHGTSVSLTYKSTARSDSAAILECNNLDVSKAAASWKQFQLQETVLEGIAVEGIKLEMQFKSLRAIVSLITSVSS